MAYYGSFEWHLTVERYDCLLFPISLNEKHATHKMTYYGSRLEYGMIGKKCTDTCNELHHDVLGKNMIKKDSWIIAFGG